MKINFRKNNQFCKLTELQRFREKIEIGSDTTCWIWIGAATIGYGCMKYGGKIQKAHRISYKLFNGELPDDLDVLHECDNPSCVNPAHLRKGTHMDNMIDMISKGRCFLAKGSKNGNSKLNEVKARYIRIYKRIPTKILSEKFGVSCVAINYVKCGTTWR